MSTYTYLNFSIPERLSFPSEFKYSKMNFADTQKSQQLILDKDAIDLIIRVELFDKSKKGFPFIEEDDKNNFRVRYGDNKTIRLSYSNGTIRLQHLRSEGNFFITINSDSNNELITREMFLYMLGMMKNTIDPAHIPFLGRLLGFDV